MPTQLTAEEMFDKWSDIYHSGSGHGNANEHHIAAMKEYALQEMVCLIGNMQRRPIQCYSQKVRGQDTQYFLGRTFCEDLIKALEKQYKP